MSSQFFFVLTVFINISGSMIYHRDIPGGNYPKISVDLIDIEVDNVNPSYDPFKNIFFLPSGDGNEAETA